MEIVKLFSREKPKIKHSSVKSEGFSGWIKCTHCHETIHLSELVQNLQCCSKCDHHYKMSIQERIDLLCDPNSFKEMFTHLEAKDPLNFTDKEAYKDRLEKAKKASQRKEGVIVGECLIDAQRVALGIMDFNFMAGSMGSVVGEAITCLIEYATSEGLPLVIVTASGGARMQESTLSLMQMAKTSAALAKHSEKGLGYVSILTDPTTGGVTASFASLGDIIIAEPKALIAFAGPRVVEQTIGHKLPEGAQRAEFLLERGMIDLICHRKELKQKLSYLLKFLSQG